MVALVIVGAPRSAPVRRGTSSLNSSARLTSIMKPGTLDARLLYYIREPHFCPSRTVLHINVVDKQNLTGQQGLVHMYKQGTEHIDNNDDPP